MFIQKKFLVALLSFSFIPISKAVLPCHIAISSVHGPRRVMVSTLKWELPYKQIKVIHEAEDRVVFSAVRDDGKRVVLKVPRRPANAMNVPEVGGPEHDIIREVEIYQRYLKKPEAADHIPAFATLKQLRNGLPYSEIEYVEGKTLYQHFMSYDSDERGAEKLRLKHWIDVYRKAIQGIVFIESEDGAQHGDIKDLNVMLTPDEKVKYIDLETLLFATDPQSRNRESPGVNPNNIMAVADMMAIHSYYIDSDRLSPLSKSIEDFNEKLRDTKLRPKNTAEFLKQINDFAKKMDVD